jgi:hypothetical protein
MWSATVIAAKQELQDVPRLSAGPGRRSPIHLNRSGFRHADPVSGKRRWNAGRCRCCPKCAEWCRQPAELPLLTHVEGQQDISAKLFCDRSNEGFRLRVLECDGKVGALRAKGLGASIGDRLFVGDANHEGFLAG